MLKKLTGKKVTMVKRMLKERTAADYCAILCNGACFEDVLPKFTMNIDMRLNP